MIPSNLVVRKPTDGTSRQQLMINVGANKGFAIVSFLLRHGSARPSMREWGKHIKRVSKCSRAHYGGCCGLCVGRAPRDRNASTSPHG